MSSILLCEQQPKGYLHYDLSFLTFSNTGTNKDFTPKASKWTLGYTLKKFTVPYLEMEIDSAIELCYLSNTASSSQNNVVANFSDVNYGKVTAYLDRLYAAYLKTPLPIGDRLDINVFLGASYSGIVLDNESFNISDNYTTSLSYGMGVEYMLPKNISLHASYMQYFENLSALEMGFGIRF